MILAFQASVTYHFYEKMLEICVVLLWICPLLQSWMALFPNNSVTDTWEMSDEFHCLMVFIISKKHLSISSSLNRRQVMRNVTALTVGAWLFTGFLNIALNIFREQWIISEIAPLTSGGHFFAVSDAWWRKCWLTGDSAECITVVHCHWRGVTPETNQSLQISRLTSSKVVATIL